MARRNPGLSLVPLVACLAAGRAAAAEPPAPPTDPFAEWSDGVAAASFDALGLNPAKPPDPAEKPWALPLLIPLRPVEPVVEAGQPSWSDGNLGTAPVRNLHRQTEGPLGSFTAQVDWRDPRGAPGDAVPDSPWRAEEAWRLPVLGPLFVFGQFAAKPDPVTADALKVNGRTGVGCKVPVVLGIEVTLRGGPALTYTDPVEPEHGEHSQLLLELLCHCPLPGRLGLEYQGTAVPALTPLEHDRITQDLGLAVPVGDAGKLRLGAKHEWENVPSTKPWLDGMQLYVGFELLQQSRKQ